MSENKNNNSVVFFNTGHRGHISPTLLLAKQFVDNGYNVYYFTEKQSHSLVEAVGCKGMCYMNNQNWTLKEFAMDQTKNVLKCDVDELMEKELLFVQVLPATIGLIDFCMSELNRINPILVVYDAACAWAKLACNKLDHIPSISSCSSTIMGDEEKTNVFSFLKERKDVQNALELLNTKYGIIYDPLNVYCNYETNIERGLTIVWSLPELQPHALNVPYVNYFGSSVLPKDVKLNAGHEFPDELLINHQKKNDKIIYFSMGTVVGQEEWNCDIISLLNRVIDALNTLPNIFVIMSIGKRLDVSTFKHASKEKFYISNCVPQVHVLQNANCFITHGGNNGFNEALITGCPMIVLPVFGDQNMNAETVLKLKLGTAIKSPFSPNPAPNLDHITKEVLLEKVEDIFKNTEHVYKPNVKNIQDKLLEKKRYLETQIVQDLVKRFVIKQKV